MSGFGNVLMISSVVAVLFCLMKFIEMKFVDKELKPLKYVIRDSVIVFLCSTVGVFSVLNMKDTISGFFNVVTDNKISDVTSGNTQIFTDAPGF
jgi:hypothetical protein